MCGKRESMRIGVCTAGHLVGDRRTMPQCAPMNIDGIPTRTLRAHPERGVIDIIDQTRLPHALHWLRLSTLEEAAHAIRAMAELVAEDTD